MPKRIIKVINDLKNNSNQESLLNLLFKYKATLIKLTSLIIAFLLFFWIYTVYQFNQAKKYSSVLHESLIAQQSGDLKTSKEKLLEIRNSSFVPSNINAIASIRYAGFLLNEGKNIEASEIYLAINKCLTCNDFLNDLAGYLAVSIWISDDEFLKNDLSSKINKIYNNSKSLKYQIAEQWGFYEIQKKNLEKANKIFDEIIDSSDADKTIKARAQDSKKMLIQKGLKISQTKQDEKKEIKIAKEKKDN